MDATRAQRRMEVAARIKELRAEQATQSESPAAAGDVAPPPEVVAPVVVEDETPETEEAEATGSAATTLADMLRSGGLFG
jgi:hypothetical protein